MDTIIFIFVLTTLLLACIGAAVVIGYISESYADKRRFQRIAFKKFIELYETCPDKWSLETNTVSFVKITDDQWKKCIPFSFDLMDRCCYYKWHRALKKQQRKEKYSKELQEVMDAIKEVQR